MSNLLLYFVLSFAWTLQTKTSHVNVALYKQAFLSSVYKDDGIERVADFGVDGIKYWNNYVHIDYENPPLNWFVVDLVHDYQIKHIILYGRGCYYGCYERMSNFVVGLSNNFSSNLKTSIRGGYELCGQWPSNGQPLDKPMRVDCSNVDRFSRFVIIQQKIGREDYLGFSELEVYTDVGPEYTVNLALNKPAYMSSSLDGNHEPTLCVDGIREGGTNYCHLGYEQTYAKNWFVVDLVEKYQVHYVVMYGRSSCCDRMDNFIVGLSNNFDPVKNTTLRNGYDICGVWPLSGQEKPMRVTCDNKEIFSRFVIIRQSLVRATKSDMGFSELEVYGGDDRSHYFGCYGSFNVVHSFQTPWLETCVRLCRNYRIPYASLNEQACECGHITGPSLPASTCFNKCDPDDKLCFIRNAYIVYKAIIVPGVLFLGCFKDEPPNRDLEHEKRNDNRYLTVEMCVEYCFQNNYAYAGLQNGRQCFCDNVYGRYGLLSEERCNSECIGNSMETCGGPSANSIYSTCYLHGLNESCSDIFHCKDFDNLGSAELCVSDECQPGWKGANCDERDCGVHNGDCGIHACVSLNSKLLNVSECECNDGYEKMYVQGRCKDIDECERKTHMCDMQTTRCMNTEGSYKCQCIEGYMETLLNRTSCTDVNECLTNKNNCSAPSQFCLNTVGSFTCNCSNGFRAFDDSSCIDVDECVESLDKCDRNVSQCNNTLGSYICHCLPGYEVNITNRFTCSLKAAHSSESESHYLVAGILIALVLTICLFCLALLLILKKVKLRKSMKVEKSDKVSWPAKTDNVAMEETKIPLEDVEKYFHKNRTQIADEFEDCPKEFGETKDYGNNPALVSKNRFKNYYPYDYNRVKLQKIEGVEYSDYINASFVKTYDTVTGYSFIAAQGPKEKSVVDFWRMVCEHDVTIIIMLTRCFEEGGQKCYQYWPEKMKESYGNFSVTVVKETKTLEYEIRDLSVEEETVGKKRVHHILYTAWMDKGVPDNVVGLLNLRERMLNFMDPSKNNTIIVHCSAGVGRTGTFIALDYLINEAEKTGGIDVYSCLKYLRKQRFNMIQAKSQYELCFRAMILFNEVGKCTYIPIDDRTKCQKFLQKLKSKNENLLRKQYDAIKKETNHNDVKELNKATINLPNNSFDGVYLPSTLKKSAYIVGTLTEQLMEEDLLTLFNENCDLIFFIDTSTTKQLFNFQPEKNQTLFFKKGSIKLISQEETTCGVKYDLEINNVENDSTYSNATEINKQINVNAVSISTFIHVKKSMLDESIIPSYDIIKDIYGLLHENVKKDTVSMIGRNGYEEPAYLVGGLNALEMMDNQHEVDIYQIVFQLKHVQPKCFSDFVSFEKLHFLVDTHLTSSKEFSGNVWKMSSEKLNNGKGQTKAIENDNIYANI